MAGLKLSVEQCAFLKHSVECLGCVIYKEGIHISVEKVKVIEKALVPNSVTQLKAF